MDESLLSIYERVGALERRLESLESIVKTYIQKKVDDTEELGAQINAF